MQKVLGLGSDPIWSILHYVVLLSIKYSLKWQSHETVQPERLLAAQHKCTRTVVCKNVWNCSSNLIAPSFQFKSLSIFQVCGQTLQLALAMLLQQHCHDLWKATKAWREVKVFQWCWQSWMRAALRETQSVLMAVKSGGRLRWSDKNWMMQAGIGPQLQEPEDKRRIFGCVPGISVILGEIYGVCRGLGRLWKAVGVIGLFPSFFSPRL